MLRQGDQLNRLSTEVGFYLVVRTAPHKGTIVPTLFQIAAEWRRLKKEEPGKLSATLATTTFQCLLRELQARLAMTSQKPEAMKEAVQLGLMNADHKWLYRKWDPEASKVVVDPNRQPLDPSSLDQVLHKLMSTVSKGGGIKRFEAMKPLAEDMTGEQIPFLIETSIRDDAFHVSVGMLTDLAALELIGARMRGQRAQRSNQADQLQKFLQNL